MKILNNIVVIFLFCKYTIKGIIWIIISIVSIPAVLYFVAKTAGDIIDELFFKKE